MLTQERLEHVNPGEARTCELRRDENMLTHERLEHVNPGEARTC